MSNTIFFVPGSFTMSHPITNSGWVTPQFLHRNLIMSHSIINRQWVTQLYSFARQSHQSCLISWPTGSEWHCFISLPGGHSNHVLFDHDQQQVSDSAAFLCQAVSSIISHPMTNRRCVTLFYFFARQSHQWCLIPGWPTVGEWYCFVSLSHQSESHLIPWPTGSQCFISLSHQ